MKHNFFNLKKSIFIVAFFFALNANAQAPEKMSYQAVVRNTANNLVTNQAVGMKISILQGSITGTAVYAETQTPTSNTNGLVSFEIGAGNPLSGTFAGIDWANGPYFVKTETDPTGGINYTISGVSQLLSTPYALYAKTSGSSIPGPQGIQGLTGATGPQGIAGTNGTNGADGAIGATGAQGTIGLTGATGATGPVGPQGIQGLTGAIGPQGIAGTNGTNGADGAIGATGPQGSIGLTGATGPQGISGTNGTNGATGAQGTIGLTGATGATGPVGPQGIQGIQGLTGATGPQGIAGSNGTNGTNGQGVPTGGAANQVLAKIDGTNYNTAWVTPAGADNLGNHTATTTLNMNSNAITNTTNITATGTATLGGNTYPTTTGTNGQVLQTNGAGALSWGSASGGGSSLQLVVTKTVGQTTQVASSLTLAADVVNFESANGTGATLTGGNTWTNTNTFTVGATGAGTYLIQVQLMGGTNNTPPMPMIEMNNTGNGASNFYGTSVTNNNAQTPHKYRGQLTSVVYMTAGEFFKIRALSASNVIGADFTTNGSTKVTVVKLN